MNDIVFFGVMGCVLASTILALVLPVVWGLEGYKGKVRRHRNYINNWY